jgi:hypothetical protein
MAAESVAHETANKEVNKQAKNNVDILRARSKITSHFDAPIHPAWLRCSSVK